MQSPPPDADVVVIQLYVHGAASVPTYNTQPTDTSRESTTAQPSGGVLEREGCYIERALVAFAGRLAKAARRPRSTWLVADSISSAQQ